jgi:hypothetical protein
MAPRSQARPYSQSNSEIDFWFENRALVVRS